MKKDFRIIDHCLFKIQILFLAKIYKGFSLLTAFTIMPLDIYGLFVPITI